MNEKGSDYFLLRSVTRRDFLSSAFKGAGVILASGLAGCSFETRVSAGCNTDLTVPAYYDCTQNTDMKMDFNFRLDPSYPESGFFILDMPYGFYSIPLTSYAPFGVLSPTDRYDSSDVYRKISPIFLDKFVLDGEFNLFKDKTLIELNIGERGGERPRDKWLTYLPEIIYRGEHRKMEAQWDNWKFTKVFWDGTPTKPIPTALIPYLKIKSG